MGSEMCIRDRLFVFQPFLQKLKIDADLGGTLEPFGDATLLETHGGRFLELIIAKAPCAEWLT